MSGKTELRRIFVAIDLSDEARAECASRVNDLRTAFSSAKVGWERPEKLHITLKFLGPMSEETLLRLNDQLEQTVPTLSGGRLRLSSPGVFPNAQRARILWIGVDDLDSFAVHANRAVEEICQPLGFEHDNRRFTPHVTIGRTRDPNSARDAVAAHLQAHIEPVEFEVNGLVVYESKLLPTGSVYSVVSRVPSR